jgi:tetratricopeptide (TPR) repeat protein
MSLESSFVIYSCVFRPGMISAGVVSIVLGYRLFRAEILAKTQAAPTSVQVSVLGQRFELRNAAAGTAFALFGVIIVSVMAVQGNPELIARSISSLSAGGSQLESEIKLRGNSATDTSKFEEDVEKGLEYERRNDLARATAKYEDALTSLATPMNQLAWSYHRLGNDGDAVPLAQLATQLSPRQAAYAATLAKVLAKLGKREEALRWIVKAAELDRFSIRGRIS